MKKEFFWQNSLFYNTFPIILFYNYSRLSAIRIISLTKRVTIIVRICLCIPKKIAWKIHIHANINESFFFLFFLFPSLLFSNLLSFFFLFAPLFNSNFGKTNTEKTQYVSSRKKALSWSFFPSLYWIPSLRQRNSLWNGNKAQV